MHRSTWAAPALVSSASRGPSSPFLVAVRSFNEYRWRSSVKWPGTMSKESRRLQKKRGSGWEQRMNPCVAHRGGKISIRKQDKERERSQAEVIKLATLGQVMCPRPPQPSHSTRSLDGGRDCYTLLQTDSCQLARSGRSAWIDPPQLSPSREKDIDSYCFSFTISRIFCSTPPLSFT